MSKAVTLNEQHYQVVADKARARGQTPEQYLEELIAADTRTFDDLLGPVRKGFDTMSDEELEKMWDRAKNASPRPE
jgi:hypothetical protein